MLLFHYCNHLKSQRTKDIPAGSMKWFHIYLVTVTNIKRSLKHLGIFDCWSEPYLCKLSLGCYCHHPHFGQIKCKKRKNGTSPAKIKWECLCLKVHGNFFKFQICQFKWKINQNLILKNVPERWKGWKEGIIIGNHQTFLKLLRYLTLESCICFTWLKELRK